MPAYKLIYFNGRGRGEVSRWLFALAGVAFEDQRFEFEEWGKKKDQLNTPFGQLPCLSVDGKLYSQSISIQRYLADVFGFAGKTELDKLRADMIVHCIEDMCIAVFRPVYEVTDEKQKEELIKKLKDTELNTYFTNLEKILKENNGGDGYFVGDSITWADLTFAHFAENPMFIGIDVPTFLSKYPKLNALREKVLKQPKIAEWIAKRPNTPW